MTTTNPNEHMDPSTIAESVGRGLGRKLNRDSMLAKYQYEYKALHFPRLLQDETVPEADKAIIRNMLTKPWNLYVYRHSALTEKSQFLTESTLRDHARWTMTSKMPSVYVHYFGTESAKKILFRCLRVYLFYLDSLITALLFGSGVTNSPPPINHFSTSSVVITFWLFLFASSLLWFFSFINRSMSSVVKFAVSSSIASISSVVRPPTNKN
jgi:hypothetical protein